MNTPLPDANEPPDTATAGGPAAEQTARRPTGCRRWLRCGLVGTGLIVLACATYWGGRSLICGSGPTEPTEIYRGVWYWTQRLEPTEEGSGLVHITKVDLTAPGIELYVTPLDAEAVEAGWQYRLDFATWVADREELAVVINATLFETDSAVGLPGSWARSNETVVSAGEVSHVHEHSYLLWFDQNLSAHMETEKPPRAEALRQAEWGVSGQGVALRQGHVSSHTNRVPDKRTAVGVDPERDLLWLVVFENASERLVASTLAGLNVKGGTLLDSGDSTTMVIGAHAKGVCSGPVIGDYRPVATFLGVRANRLRDPRRQ